MSDRRFGVDRSRDASSHRWVLHCLAIVLAAVLLRGLTLSLSVIDWDEAVYSLVAREILKGHWPYQTAFDHKPIGIYLHFAAAMAVGGDTPVATRALGLVVVILAALTLRWTLVRFLNATPLTSLAICLGYVIASGGLGGAATNSEHFINFYELLSVAFALHALRHDLRAMFLSGMCIGVACQINYLSFVLFSGLIVGLVFCVFISNKGARYTRIGIGNMVTIILSGAVFSFVLLLLPIVLFSNIAQYFKMQYEFLSAYVPPGSFADYLKRMSATAPLFFPVLAMIIFLLVSNFRNIGTQARASGRGSLGQPCDYRALVALFSCLGFGAIAAICASTYFFPHYFLLLLPPLCLLLAVGLGYAGSAKQIVPLALTVFLASTVVIGVRGFTAAARGGITAFELISGGETTLDVPRLVASRVSALLAPGQTVYVVCADPVIYQLLGVTAPTRFPFYPHQLYANFAKSFGFDVGSSIDKVLQNQHVSVVIKGNTPDCGPIFEHLAEAGYDFNKALLANGFRFSQKISGHLIYLR